MPSPPHISIVLGSYNRLKFLKLTIESIRQECKGFGHPCEIIVVDGGSTDGSIKWLTKQKDIISIIQHNRGTWQGKKITRRSWGYFMNLGFKCAQGKYICMVSDDCLIVPGSLANGYKFFEEKLSQREKVGALAFFCRNIPFSVSDWSKPGRYEVNKVFDKFYLNNGLYLKSALEEIGYIDEENFLFYCGDIDLCFKLNAKGYSCIPAPDSYIEHYPHAKIKTRKINDSSSEKDFQALQKKWGIFTPYDQSFSHITKTFLDPALVVNKFKRAHFTNFEFWSMVIKDIYKRRKKKLLGK